MGKASLSIRASLLDLKKVPSVLRSFDLEKRPDVVCLDMGPASIVYLATSVGYTGQVQRKNGQVLGVSQFSLRDENIGVISPPNVTSHLCKVIHGSRDTGREQFTDTLKVIMAGLLEVLGDGDRRMPSERLNNLGGFPDWLTFRDMEDGEEFDEGQEHIAIMAAVPAYIVDFCRTTHRKMEVDMTKRLTARIHFRDMVHIVVSGEWDDQSQAIANQLGVTYGESLLAMDQFVKFTKRSWEEVNALKQEIADERRARDEARESSKAPKREPEETEESSVSDEDRLALLEQEVGDE